MQSRNTKRVKSCPDTIMLFDDNFLKLGCTKVNQQLDKRIKTRQRCLAREKLKLIEKYRKDLKKKKPCIQRYNSTVLCFPQDTCGLNVRLKDQTDLAEFSSLGDDNHDTDPHPFTSGQCKVQSDEVEDPLIGDHETQESEGGETDLLKHLLGCDKNPGTFVSIVITIVAIISIFSITVSVFRSGSKPQNLNCVSRSEDNVNIVCTATKIFPEAVCLFTIDRNAHK
ncbi:strain i4 polymorphic transmembrane cluster 2 transmembrane protein 3 (PTC2-3), partial [Biomphalaria pfeifferi]